MASLRLPPRLALLDLELRRLWREPWLAHGSIMLLPIAVGLLLAGTRSSAAPGAELFGILVWSWCLAAHVILLPLMGLAFRGEDRQEELEALQMAGYSGFSLCAGVLGPRLLTALAVLLIPMPVAVLCSLLGGLSGTGLLAAALHLSAHFLFIAGQYALLGVALPIGSPFWAVSVSLAVAQTLTPLPGPALAGALRASALALDGNGGTDPWATRVQLGLGCILFFGTMRVLGIRLGRGTLAGEVPHFRNPWRRRQPRPLVKEAIRWKERWFSLGRPAEKSLWLGWGPAAAGILVVAPAFLARGRMDYENVLLVGFFLILGCGMAVSIAHGILCAHRLFARERTERTLDDLVLARCWVFGVIHEKLEEYRSASQGIWSSCVCGMMLAGLVLFGLTILVDVTREFTIAALVGPLAGFLVYRLQEGFILDLFLAWSGPDGASPAALAREGSRFVSQFLSYLLVITGSVLALFSLASLLAVLSVPFFRPIPFHLLALVLLVATWFRHLGKRVRRKRRRLLAQICASYEESGHEESLDRLYPDPDCGSKKSPRPSARPG